MLGDLIFFNCNLVVPKKKTGKTSNNCYFWDQIAHKKGSVWATHNPKNKFCAEITKADHKLSKKIIL